MTSSEKLSRLKFRGALKVVLGLDLNFEQFEGLWRRIKHPPRHRKITTIIRGQSQPSSHILWEEYRSALAPSMLIRNISQGNGVTADGGDTRGQSATTTAVDTLIKALAEFEEVGLGFGDAFDAFDSNASGEISISEFLGLMKMLGGLTKREML